MQRVLVGPGVPELCFWAACQTGGFDEGVDELVTEETMDGLQEECG